MNILIVEDQVTLAKNITHFLRRRGYTVSAVNTVIEASNHLARHETQLMVIDVNLPDGNGLEMYDSARSKYREIKAVLMSGHLEPVTTARAYALGISDILIKPFALSKLLLAVQSA